MATLRSEFFAVVARVGLRFAAGFRASGRSLREGEALGLVSSPDWDKYGLDVKKVRFLGMQGAVRWKDLAGRCVETTLCICLATTNVILCDELLIVSK